MKRVYSLGLLAIAALVSWGCREMDSEDVTPVRKCSLTSFQVSFASREMGTKSVVTSGVEGFKEAFLFAFWASGTDAGEPCMVEGAPIALYTDSKTFQWSLPADEPIEVMAVVNAVEAVRVQLDRWARGLEAYTRDDLLSLKFTCESASDLRSLEDTENNMPMTGSVTLTLERTATGFTIPVKRLFAKFDITLDSKSLADDGWTVTAARVTGARSNTEVPYFYTGTGAGFRQTDSGKFASVDNSTDEDLDNLNFRDSEGRSRAVTYYFLENCQDVSGSASRWSSVALDLGSLVDNCSFLKVSVGANKPGYGERRFGYRIYLDSSTGSSMNTGFNIIRNTYRSIVLKLGTPQDGFLWTNTSALTVSQGETVDIPFETTLDNGSLTFLPLNPALEYVSHTFHENTAGLTSFQSGGTAVFRASGSAPDGIYTVRGGNGAGDISDEVDVQVSSPVSLTYSIASSHYAFQRFTITLHSESTEGWNSEKKSRLESIFSSLSLRCTSADTHLISAGSVFRTSVNGTDDVLNRQFTVMSTMAATATFEAYDTVSDISYATISVPVLRPTVKFIESVSGSYSDNMFVGYDTYGDDGPIYLTPITGEEARGYFQFQNGSGNPIQIMAADLALGTLELSSATGFHLTVRASASIGRTYVIRAYLENWDILQEDGFRSNIDGICAFTSEMYPSNLSLRSESGQLICSEPVHFKVTNPFSEWFPGGNFTPFVYTVVLDGSLDAVNSEDFSGDWPYSASLQPTVLSHGNVNTSKGGYAPYRLVWEYHSNEVESLMVADDLRNYGLVEIGNTITHTRTGDSMTMLWGKVNVIREYVIYAGYQFSQVNYLNSPTDPVDSGDMSRFIPYIFVRDNTGLPITLKNAVKTTATAVSGINTVNPSENYYVQTCAAEHWWPDHANKSGYDPTNSTLWDCEYADRERSYLFQNRIVVYPSAKTVTPRGELSYYEILYAGPVVDSHLNFFLGHHGHHADNIYSFRSVAYWNEPAFEFHTVNINPMYSPEVRTFPSGEKYLAIGEFTRYRFFWRMRKHNMIKLNAYDTRYAIDVTQFFQTTYTSTGDGASYQMFYFGDNMTTHTYTATAYYDPRRNVRERLKLYTPSIPFYRRKGNTVHEAFDGPVTGSYKEEDIVNTHMMWQAIGKADSFWLPDNQID